VPFLSHIEPTKYINMAIPTKTVRVQLRGRRKVQFENLQKETETTDAELLRRIIDSYFKN